MKFPVHTSPLLGSRGITDILEYLYIAITYIISIALYTISIDPFNSQAGGRGQIRKSLLSFLQMRKPRFRNSIYFTWLALDARLL